jgi:type VI secretion system protein ImpF
MIGDSEETLQMSLLDRLLDGDPAAGQERRVSRGQARQDFYDAVRRDLEALLNTRPCSVIWADNLGQLDSSILNYGVNTVGSTAMGAEVNRERFRAEIEEAIRRFEPRFLRTTVSLVSDAEALDRTIRFRIEALVQTSIAPEPLVFDSMLNPSTQGVTVAVPRHV